MHKKFQWRRYLVALFTGIFAVAGLVVAVETPAKAANDLGYNSTVDNTLMFDGSTQSANTAATTVIPGTSSFTAEAWFQESSGATGQRIFLAQGVFNNSSARFAIGLDGAANNRTFQIWMKGASVVNLTNSPVTQDAWHHVAVAFTSGTGYTVYLDGNVISTEANTSAVNIAGAFWVGRNYYGAANYFNGKVDEVKIWSTVRSASEISSDMHVYGSSNSATFDANLRAYYDMNEGSGTTVFNRTANSGLNLTANAGPTYEDVKTTSKNSGKTVLTFPRTYLTSVGGWTVPSGASRAEVLVAGGGGGGAENVGAGGSGGGLAYTSAKVITPSSALSVVVGQGGKGATYYLDNASNSTAASTLRDGGNGQNSSVGFSPALVGTGGIGGQTYWLDNKCGGAGNNNVDTLGVAGTGGDTNLAGGIGGKGAAGSGAGFNGGAGNAGWTIRLAASETFGGGGGGGSFGSASGGTGGTGAGSGGSASGDSGSAALANTGGGGGGGSLNCGAGGNGGSGIVIIAYAPTEDKSLIFNGTSQSASAASSTVISASGAFTVEAWVKADSDIPSNAVILSQGTGTNRFYLKRNNGNIIAYRDGGASEINCGPLTTAQWTHIAVSMDGTNAYCFIDGALTKTVSNSFSTKTIAAKFYVGQYSAAPTGSNEFWKGAIDQIKVWNTAITSSALITRSMNTYADKDSTGYISGSAASVALTQLFDFNEASASVISAAIGNETLSTVDTPVLTKVVTEQSFGANSAYTFTRTVLTSFGGWFNPHTSSVGQALIVGGGGGGGKPGNPQSLTGGGGGAGAVYQISNISLPTSAIPVVVGQGGRGGQTNTDQGLAGGDSKIGTLLVGGGGGGNSYLYTGGRTVTPGGASYVAGGNGGGGRQDAGAATASYNLGGLAGASSNQVFNGTTFSALSGVAGGNDNSSDSGTGGLGGASVLQVSNISGSTIKYAKSSGYRIWSYSLNTDKDKTPGSGGSPNYAYGAGTSSDVGEYGASGVVVISMGPAPVINMDASNTTSLSSAATSWNSVAPGVSLNSTSVSGVTLKTSGVRSLAIADAGYVNMGSNNAANISGAITVEAWIKCSPASYRTSGWNIFASHWFSSATAGTGENDWHFGIYNNKLRVDLTGNTAGGGLNGATTWNSTNCAAWNQLVFTLDASGNLKLYVNGVEDASATGVTRTASTTNVLRIGDGRNALAYIGDYSVFRMYNTALTASQVSANYSTTNASLSGALNVTYETNGGSSVTSTTTTSGGTVAQPTAPSKNGYTFAGWYATSDLSGSAISSWPYTHAQTADFTLYAKWTANNLTVTYDSQSGTAVSGGSVTTGASIASAPTQPTRPGYTFLGWFNASTGGSAISFPYAHGQTANFTLYAQWTANTLNVTWNSNSGSTVNDTTTTTGVSIASAPASPTRAGYTFAGWYEQSGLTSQAVFPNYVHGRTADFTLYAKWTANPTRTITYSLAGGSSTLPTQSAVQEGLSFSVAGTPVKFGYTFTGWSDGTNSYLGGTTYTVGSSNITLTATWSADTLNVTWNSNGGSAVSGTTTVTGGTVSSAPTAPTKLGYNFAGWFEESGLSTEAIFPNYVHGRGTSFTLYAKWTAATYTITYKAGSSGTGSDLTQTFVYGNSISIKDATAPLTRAGYSISGWAASDGGLQSKALSASYSSAADLTLYPVWSANTNSVSYDVQGGSSVSSGSFTTGSTLTLPAASVRSGYTFQGWYTAATGGTKVGNANATISPPNTSDVTLYAQWVAVNYSVTYDANTAASGSVPTDTNNYNVGGDHIVRGNSGSLAKTGYAFGGWTTNSNGTGTVYNSGEVYTFADASVTFYAKWLANTYTITYNSNGATSGSPTSATQTYTSGNAGVTLTTVGSLEKTGYTFGGWSIVAGGAALSGPYTTSADVTLYAVWNIKTVSITYAKGIASAAAFTDFPASPQTATFAVRASLASNVDILVSVASATYRFVGWSDGSSIYAAGSTYLLGDTDVTMTAQWVRVLQVRYTLNGGTGVLPGDDECITDGGGGIFLCDANQVITASVAPNRTGYEFAGWKDQNNFTIAAGATFTVTSSKYLLYAQWTPVNYTVTYVSNGGATAPTETAKNIGDIFTVANGVTRTGYSFNGWSDGSRNYGAGASYQVGSTNVTLTAQWVADVYTITYDWNGGTGTATANGSYTVGTSGLTLPSVGDHVKDGYSFAGWSETRNGTALTGAYQPTQSRTLYAVWGSGSYTVTYDANGGTAAAASASVVNGGSTLLPSATRANYVFEGWYSAQTGGSSRGVAAGVFTPTGSTTLYARWTQLSLYGINPVHLTRVGTLTASGINSSYSGSNAGSSVQVTVPANTLPTGTTVNLDLVSDFTRAGNLLNDPANFIVSLVVSWVASDGTVPNTYSGKAVSVTIQNSSIKAGSSVYSILGSHVTLLGTAILDGTVTVSLTQDPEIVIAATKPTAPQTVTAVAGQTGTANVSWSAPSSNGGATITGYTVTASTGQTCTTVTTSCAVTGLTSGATYTFTVTATNSVGTSAASAASSALSLNSAPISSPNSGSPNIGGPVVKAPITSNDRGQQIFEVSQKKVATTGGSVLKIDTKNMEDISNVTVNGKKAKILGIVDGEIKLQIPSGTKGDAKVVFSGPTGILTMEQVISFVAPKQVDVVASAAMPQGVWTIATPAVQALRKTLLANPDTVLINCVGYQSYAYNTPFDAVVAKQRAKNACAYLASQAPGVTIKTSVVRTKLTGPQSRKIKVTFSAVR